MLHQKQTFLTITVHIMFSKKQKTSNLSVLAARKFPPAALVPSCPRLSPTSRDMFVRLAGDFKVAVGTIVCLCVQGVLCVLTAGD